MKKQLLVMWIIWVVVTFTFSFLAATDVISIKCPKCPECDECPPCPSKVDTAKKAKPAKIRAAKKKAIKQVDAGLTGTSVADDLTELLASVNKQVADFHKDATFSLATKHDDPDVVLVVYLPHWHKGSTFRCSYGKCIRKAADGYCPIKYYDLTALGRQKLAELESQQK